MKPRQNSPGNCRLGGAYYDRGTNFPDTCGCGHRRDASASTQPENAWSLLTFYPIEANWWISMHYILCLLSIVSIVSIVHFRNDYLLSVGGKTRLGFLFFSVADLGGETNHGIVISGWAVANNHRGPQRVSAFSILRICCHRWSFSGGNILLQHRHIMTLSFLWTLPSKTVNRSWQNRSYRINFW